MASLSSINRHLDRMEAAIASARRRFINAGTLESDKEIVAALGKAVVEEIAGLTEIITDERVVAYVDEALIEAVNIAFKVAIDKRDDRNSPENIAAAKADAEREMA